MIPRRDLTLGELEALASTGLAGLLAFLHARISGQKAKWLDDLAVFRVHLGERSADGVADGDGLGMDTTALNHDSEIELVDQRELLEGSQDAVLEFRSGQIFFEVAAIDGNLAGAFSHPYTGNCGFAATCGAGGGSGGHE